ncbi:MAG: hypothetical protein C3F02_04905 [Parcubacteria group bacterium]|nr:MAG: hypothetical protein C3F02_04905 [Parcubacteria group bacterium]
MSKDKTKGGVTALLHPHEKMHVVAVDMGYGHQRAAYPFLDVAYGGQIINANRYPGISAREQRTWEGSRFWYELISRFKRVPLIGSAAFGIMDYFQRIEPFYPRRDLSRISSQLNYFIKRISNGLGLALVQELNKTRLPLLSTFFVTAYFAEAHNFKEAIYAVVCDADVARAWAPPNSHKSRIIYLVPNKRVKERLQLYGVAAHKIYVTGFPLPKENIGGREQPILKKDLRGRLYNLDPRGVYRKKYAKLIEAYLCPVNEIKKNKHPLTVTFAVGGAGAQRDVGVTIVERLANHCRKNMLRLNLVAGIRNDVYLYYERVLKEYKLENLPNVNVLYANDKMEYFKSFNKALRTTDVLWTKPSELTFYTGLGLPIVMADPVGAQERYNRDWLIAIGGGINSEDPRYVNEWLFDWLNSGWLAEAAMEGYLDAPKLGTYHIEDIILKGRVSEIEDVHLL